MVNSILTSYRWVESNPIPCHSSSSTLDIQVNTFSSYRSSASIVFDLPPLEISLQDCSRDPNFGHVNNNHISVVSPQVRLRNSFSSSARLHRYRNNSNLVVSIRSGGKNSVFGPSVLLANTMSLAPKIEEVRSVILDLKPNLRFFTETWLKDTVSDSHLCIPGYSFIYRNRTTEHHGGVGLYVENSIQFKRLGNLLDPDIEALWAWLRPSRLPRGVPCLIADVIYHPYFNDSYRDAALVNYLSASLTSMEGEYPG